MIQLTDRFEILHRARLYQNLKQIGQLKRMLWTNEISRDLGLRWVSGGYPILHSTPGHIAKGCGAYCFPCRGRHHVILRFQTLDLKVMLMSSKQKQRCHTKVFYNPVINLIFRKLSHHIPLQVFQVQLKMLCRLLRIARWVRNCLMQSRSLTLHLELLSLVSANYKSLTMLYW